ncbi:GDP-mannose 4,6 dehydratase 2 [Capsicum annuum]|uniref:GDP-mannose 4,6-dehydratase n=1 Tax=Capsicum annuum TaxID=4072 RepID=A0A2G3A2X7_CAPAN|nr:GDP-mannose 4,6 dehydratase 2 [Capsicum annuum]
MATNRSESTGDSDSNGDRRKVALITGITGQDGSYLTEFLLNKGYEVHGLIRRSSNFNTQRVNHIYIDPHNVHKARMKLHYADLTDASSLRRWIDTIQPDEVYNLAAQSHVAVSFEIPDYTADVVATGALRLLEAVRSHISATGRSHIRGENFVTRKITRAVGRIKIGLQSKLFLGNLQASRDWGFAGDYVEAMWMMLQQDKPDDYVVATEESHTVEEFLEVAFGYVGLNWSDHVVIDKRYFRPAEVDNLKGDSSKARKVLGWKPKVGFKELVKMMVDEDVELAKREKVLVDAGYMDAQQQP